MFLNIDKSKLPTDIDSISCFRKEENHVNLYHNRCIKKGNAQKKNTFRSCTFS